MEINIDHVVSRSIAALPTIAKLATLTKNAGGYGEVTRLAKELEVELSAVLEKEFESNGKRALEMVLRNNRLLYKFK
tara:strand:- start:1230 stop:1460 length:231 start_codon:yes stop_codon:yes gene_type:complete